MNINQHSIRIYVAGFSFIELMVALVIAAVLASLAIPSYNRFIERTYREEGKSDLISLSATVAALKARTSNSTLPNNIENQIPSLLTKANDYYDFQLTPLNNRLGYWLAAVPKAGERLNGSGGLTLSDDGLGCWHQTVDQPATFLCTGAGQESW